MVKGNSTTLVGVEVADGGVVGHVGLHLLGWFADRLGSVHGCRRVRDGGGWVGS